MKATAARPVERRRARARTVAKLFVGPLVGRAGGLQLDEPDLLAGVLLRGGGLGDAVRRHLKQPYKEGERLKKAR